VGEPLDKHIQEALDGKDFTLGVDDEFRERLINELRHFPNILVIAGDANGSTHTVMGNNDELAKAIIQMFRTKPELFDFFKLLMEHV